MEDTYLLDLMKNGLKGALEDLSNRQDEILSIIEAEKGLRNLKITINMDIAEIVTYTIEKDYFPTCYMPNKEK